MSIKLVIILILSIGLVQSKTFEKAMEEYVEVIKKIGTGICSSRKFQGLSTQAQSCAKNSLSQSQFLTKFASKFIIFTSYLAQVHIVEV